ncbi:MAG: radical SAM protein [Patescibacteria group bacterium]
MKNLKVLAINLCLRPYKSQILFPIGFAYVVSAIDRAGYNLEILDLDAHRKTDEEVEEFLRNTDFDVVAMGCIVTGYKYVKKISQIVRKVNSSATIIAGNSVASSISKILLEKTEVDIAVIGEGDITIVETLDSLKKKTPLFYVDGLVYKNSGRIVPTSPRTVIPDVNSISSPNWDLLDIERYIEDSKNLVDEPFPIPKNKVRAFPINTARGCPFKCTFCYQVFRGLGYRYRSAESLISEIKELQRKYGINYILFHDDLSFFSRDQIEKFVDMILSEKLKFFWGAACRADLFSSKKDMPLLKKIKKSGCLGLGYSLESANPEILKAMNKKLNVEDFIRQTKLLNEVDLSVWTSLVFGYPQETVETIRQTLNLCCDLDVYPSAGYLLPQPGTPMWDVLLNKETIRDEESLLMALGDRQDLRFNLTQIPDDVFQAEVKNGLKRISDKLELKLKGDPLKTNVHRAKKKRG